MSTIKTKDVSHSFGPALALILAFTMWGINTPVIKLGLESIPIASLLAIKITVAALLILPFAKRSWKPLSLGTFIRFAISSLLWVCLGNIALYSGLKLAPSINAAVIGLFGPLFLFALSIEFLKEKFSRRTLIGIFVAIIGGSLVIGLPTGAGLGSQSYLAGNLLFFAAIMTHVISTIVVKPALNKTSTPQATFLGLSIGILPVIIIALTQHNQWSLASTPASGWAAIIYGIATVTCAHSLLNYALKQKDAKDVGVFSYVQPAATVVAAYFLLGERPTIGFALGALLVVIGIYLAEAHLPKRLRLHYHHQHH